MATYCGAAFVGEQLESIANQTRPPDELVVSDDCSPDETVEIVERFALEAPFPVRILRNPENVGFSRNFARALAGASGDLVFLSDQDDIWLPDKIERVVAELDRSPLCLALIHDQRILDQNTSEVFNQTYFDNQSALGLAEKELVSGNFTALRRELLDILQPFPQEVSYDFWIARVADRLGCRMVLREPLQLYRRHSSNVSDPVLAQRRPSLWSELLRMGRRDPRPYWQEEIELSRLAAARIGERQDAVDRRLGKGRAEGSLANLAHEIRSLERRIEILSLPPVQRRIEVIKSWRSGFYSQFSGGRSAIKDLVQPLDLIDERPLQSGSFTR